MRRFDSAFSTVAVVISASILALSAGSCVTPPKDAPSSVVSKSESQQVARGPNGAVATAHPLATEAALDMLRGGGNAIDAAVAASFVISVVRPQSTGIGGGGFLLYADSSKQTVDAWDFRERAPRKATRNMYLDRSGQPRKFKAGEKILGDTSLDGPMAVAVPGLVAGLTRIHRELGSLPFATVMQPAIKAAEGGIDVYPELAKAIAEREAVLEAFPASKNIFFKNDIPLKTGDRLVQRDLGKTLRLIASKGADGFYRGDVARRIVREMAGGRGILSQEDLQAYKVIKREPVTGIWKNWKIVSMPPPSSGGVHIIQMLRMLEPWQLGRLGAGQPDTVHVVAESMRRAFADRAQWMGDPDFVRVPVSELLSSNWITAHRATIDLKKATPSATLPKTEIPQAESGSTTHISIVDRKGNAVTTTQTINYIFGSGVVAQGTGVVLNNEMDDFAKKPGVPNVFGLVGSEANSVAAGKTPLSSMSPTFVFTDTGKLQLIVGSPGGPRIITSVLQTIINHLEHEMPLPKAVAAPRIHHQFLPDMLQIEEGALGEVTQQKILSRGHEIKIVPPMGNIQAIARDGLGWIAVSDPRSTGRAGAL